MNALKRYAIGSDGRPFPDPNGAWVVFEDLEDGVNTTLAVVDEVTRLRRELEAVKTERDGFKESRQRVANERDAETVRRVEAERERDEARAEVTKLRAAGGGK